jgi:phage shock protein E
MIGIFKKLFAKGDDTKLRETIIAGAVLIDVRSAAEFASGNITGSVNIPLDRLNNQAGLPKKDKPIIVFCRSGNRSMAAKAILEKKGFSNIVDGGSIYTVNKLINTK